MAKENGQGVRIQTNGNGMPAPPAARGTGKSTVREGNEATRQPGKEALPVTVSRVTISVPLVGAATSGHCTRQITINDLTPRQTEVYQRLGARLVAEGTRMSNGRLVSSQHQYDAIRWLLDQIADQAGVAR